MGEVNQFYPLSFCLYPLVGGGSYLSRGDHGSCNGFPFIPYPFALILFKGETRARLFAFFSLSALIIHPRFNAASLRLEPQSKVRPQLLLRGINP
jgi:hypothetical protein